MMNRFNFLLVLSLGMLAFACNQNSKAQKQELPKGGAYYGEEFKPDEVVSVENINEKMKKEGGYAGVVKGEVTAACKKKGCWMKMNTGQEDMRIFFKDYGFFVPTDSEGADVYVRGKVFYDTTSVKELRHYAMDGGANEEEIAQITKPKVQLVMEADGVYMYNKQGKKKANSKL